MVKTLEWDCLSLNISSLLTSCVTLGTLLNLSVLSLLTCEMELL